MRPWLAALTLIAGVAVVASCARPGDSSHDGQTPDRQRWLLINYWAVWCAPCRHEIPELNRLAAEHAGSVQVLGVNFDGLQGSELADAVKLMGIDFATAGSDPASRFGFSRPKVLPTTFLIDPAGRLRHELQGPQTYDGLLALIDDQGRPPAAPAGAGP